MKNCMIYKMQEQKEEKKCSIYSYHDAYDQNPGKEKEGSSLPNPLPFLASTFMTYKALEPTTYEVFELWKHLQNKIG